MTNNAIRREIKNNLNNLKFWKIKKIDKRKKKRNW